MSLQKTIYDLFDNLPLGDSPFGRGLIVLVATSGLMYLIKPQFAFDSDGNPKNWIVFQKGPNTTGMPFYLPGLLLGTFVWLFI